MSAHAQQIDGHRHAVRELAHRSNNGVNVTLSWDAETDELLVSVYDERRDVYFEIQPERDFALDV